MRYVSGQTNKQTNTLIAILRTPSGGEVKIVTMCCRYPADIRAAAAYILQG